jgi:subtilase family serine protease
MQYLGSSKRARIAPRILSMTVVLLFVGGYSGAVALSAATTVANGAFGLHTDLVAGAIHPMATETCSKTGLCPTQVQTAYSFGSLLKNSTMNGTGQSVVIVDACGDSAISTDVATFDSVNSLPAINLTVYQPQGKPCSNPTGWGVETALDVEWAHAMAPGASIHLVEAKSATNANLYGAWNYSLKHHLGLVISNSWGGNGACSSAPAYLVGHAATLGVSVLASAGDGGAWGSGQTLAAQAPADCASVVTIGGTTLNVATGGGYSSESAWSGSGGGYTPKTTEPSYQSTDKITDSYSELGKPDVAAVADPSTGVWMYEKASGGWFIVGGTSVACPIWAAFLADVNSWRAANSFGGLGAVDPFLYTSIYGVSGGAANYSIAFHDVTTGSNGWSAGTGWDAATGMGSFIAYPLANLLANNAAA